MSVRKKYEIIDCYYHRHLNILSRLHLTKGIQYIIHLIRWPVSHFTKDIYVYFPIKVLFATVISLTKLPSNKYY